MSLSDDEQSGLHLVIWGLCQWDMQSLDDWLADDADWPGREHVRERLHDGRKALRHAFAQDATDELIELYANNLLLKARVESMYRAGFMLEIEQGARNERQRAKSKLPRRKDELRGKIVAVLGCGRRAEQTLLETLASWRQSGVEDGLRLTYRRESDDYVIHDENGFTAPRAYQFKTLEELFANAAK